MMRAVGCRLLGAALLALPLLSAAGTTAAGTSGTVVFELRLLGDVPAADSFRVLRDTVPPSIIEPGLLVCGPVDPDGGTDLPVCASGGVYRLESPVLPVGTELTYGITRNDVRVSGLSGSVTVAPGEGSRTVSLTYDYSLGTVPNTATRDSVASDYVPLAAAGLTLLLLTATWIGQRRRPV